MNATALNYSTRKIGADKKNPARKFLLLFFLTAFITPATTAQSNNLSAADSLYTRREWKAAKERYVSYLNDTSVNAIAWNHLAVCNYNLGSFNEAVKNYQTALSFNPVPQIKCIIEARLARTYAAMNRPDQALDWLDKAAATGYRDLKDIDTSADFNKLRAGERFKSIYKMIYGRVYPCVMEPRSRDFDFWVGEWDVYATNSKILVGHSIVNQFRRVAGFWRIGPRQRIRAVRA